MDIPKPLTSAFISSVCSMSHVEFLTKCHDLPFLTSKLWIARKCSYPEIPDSDVKRIDPDKVQKMEEDQILFSELRSN